MPKNFHRLLGGALLVTYVWFLTRIKEVTPGLGAAMDPMAGSKANGGALNALIVPLLAIGCFLEGDFLSRHFSPRTPLLNDRIVTPGFYYLLGYGFLAASVLLVFVFRSE